MSERVSNEPFRREYLRNEEITAADVCRAAGWMRVARARNGTKIRCADVSRVPRVFGIKPNNGTIQTTMRYEDAVALLNLFDFDPVDVGV